ncbi:MAG: DNA polymerase II large subunit [Thermoplasmata archaeon]|nr:DNA polymerase II large subunit [Thermoplasmata archaeon]
MQAYFKLLEQEAERCYVIAAKARMMGLDPSLDVEIPRAKDLADRVERQLVDYHVEGVAALIRELSEEYGREEIALLVAKDFAKRPANTREEALDRAVRIGLSVLTEGILVAPLEGIVEVKIGRNEDGTEHAAIYFAGPIRSAGGTGQAMSVLICDVVRREMGLDAYKPSHAEVERFKEEMPLYKQSQHLQYTPEPEEIELIVKNCPVSIDGEGTEDVEVSGFRDMKKVPTNKVRGGACLVIAEGMVQKASKLMKHVDHLKLDGWDFLGPLTNTSSEDEGKEEDSRGPKAKYIKDLVAGRPILSHPSRQGGFRLRYGRARTTGLAATAISPASMAVFEDMIAIGTQVKVELPGKAGAVTPCDTIEGPLVILSNGDLVLLNSEKEARERKDSVMRIIDVGEMLVPFGEFVENNHPLRPGAYAIERWLLEAKKAGIEEPPMHPSAEEAFSISEKYDIPLHPDHNLFWHDLSREEMTDLSSMLEEKARWDGALLVPNEGAETLQKLGCVYMKKEEGVLVDHYAPSLLRCLGLEHEKKKVARRKEVTDGEAGGCALASELAGIKIMPRAPTRIGARMGRPEKAKERKMKPPVHCLFPVGMEVGAQRLIKDAAAKGTVNVEVGMRECTKCGRETYLSLCSCGGHTEPSPDNCYSYITIPAREMVGQALSVLGMGAAANAKGVKGLISSKKVPEALEKGLLRAKHGVYVFKDGTIRFDLTDLPLTHFRPREIGLTVERCRELGYEKDWMGEELKDEEQVVELKVQDVVLSKGVGEYMVHVAAFLDDLLERVYGLEKFYKVEKAEDMVGHLMVGLAPHTSGGVLVRLIGFTDAAVGYGHPFFHAAKRRNCDGDEDCVMLLMDGLLNFSKQFLPRTRGGLMDAPLVLTMRIDPMEIDKEAHNIDILSSYPLEFYELADLYTNPSDVDCVETIRSRLKEPGQYEGFGFTHDTHDIAEGVKVSSYKTLATMEDKTRAQLSLARKIRAVDEDDTASRIITLHFMPDMIGNMKKFCAQKFRCTKCNTTYRRIPLSGQCTKKRKGGYFQGGEGGTCGGRLVLTVYEKGVLKYLDRSKRIAGDYNVSEYTRQRLDLLEGSMDSLFNNGKMKTCNLEDFF